jgi:hypothetical protein
MVFTAVAIRRALREQFPEDTGRGHVAYGVMRTLTMRRMRVPRPQVHP